MLGFFELIEEVINSIFGRHFGSCYPPSLTYAAVKSLSYGMPSVG